MRAPGPNGVILPSEADSGSGTEGGSAPEVLLSVRELTHRFAPARGLGRGRALPVQALRGVSLDLWKGECLAVVGESGSGKTTLARAILSLIRPTGGEVLFRGRDVLKMRGGELMEFRRRAQIVFQDPFGSLNPRLRAGAMLEEVLKVHGNLPGSGSRRDRVAELLRLVGLNERHAGRLPHEFSGGQRQRLGIARALSVDPELLVLDEPVSALDLSVRAQVLNLLKDLQQRLSLTMLLVAHDLSVVRQVADRVVLLYAGTVVESAPVEALFADPVHPYTRGLMAAADPLEGTVLRGPAGGDEMMVGAGSEASPATDPLGITAESSGRWASIPGESPSPTRPPEGCAFHPRCPHSLKDEECVLASPGLTDLGASRTVACWKEGRGEGGA